MHCGRWNHNHLNGKTKDVEALSRHLLSSLRRQHTWTGHPSSAGMKARCLGTVRPWPASLRWMQLHLLPAALLCRNNSGMCDMVRTQVLYVLTE